MAKPEIAPAFPTHMDVGSVRARRERARTGIRTIHGRQAGNCSCISGIRTIHGRHKKPAFLRVWWMALDAIGRQCGGLGRNRTGVRGFAVRCMTTLPPSQWLSHHQCILRCSAEKQNPGRTGVSSAIWSGKRDSNSRPRPWQGRALPTELFPRGTRILLCGAPVSTPGSALGMIDAASTRLRLNAAGAAPARRRARIAGRTRWSAPRRPPAGSRRRRTVAGSRDRAGTAAPRSRRSASRS